MMPRTRRERSARLRGGALPRLRVGAPRPPRGCPRDRCPPALAVTAAGAMILAASPERSADAGVPHELRGVWRAPPKQLRMYAARIPALRNLGLGSSGACYTLGTAANRVAVRVGHAVGRGRQADPDAVPKTRRPACTGGASSGTLLRLTKLHDRLADPREDYSWPRRSRTSCGRQNRGRTSSSGGTRHPFPLPAVRLLDPPARD